MNRPPPSLLQDLEAYHRRYPEESEVYTRFVQKVTQEADNCLYRENLEGHLTSSAWVINAEATHVLLLHHRKLDRWLQPGGHADGDPDLLASARREVEEETGLKQLTQLEAGIYDLDIHRIPARGDTPAHDHFDVRYIFQAQAHAMPQANEESHHVEWVPINELEPRLHESSILRMVRKLNQGQ